MTAVQVQCTLQPIRIKAQQTYEEMAQSQRDLQLEHTPAAELPGQLGISNA
jgi:hypothetical protein